MALSKRLRYEVLRRDNYTCQYCGITAREVPLTVDAVLPASLGGTHKDPANLVAACRDCNGGKTSSHPQSPFVADVPAQALRWGMAIKFFQRRRLADLEARETYRVDVWQVWNAYSHSPPQRPSPYWTEVIDECYAIGLPLRILEECMRIATDPWDIGAPGEAGRFCDLARREAARLQQDAYAAVTAEGGDT